MPLTFHCLSGSPFSWRVWLALEHKEVEYTLNVLSADAGDLEKPRFLAINPRGKVPAIVDDDFVLYESTAIVEYLEDQFSLARKPLWPSDKALRALGRRTVSEVDNYLYPPVRLLVEQLVMRGDGTPNEAEIATARNAAADNLAIFARAALGEFLVGEVPSAADFALYPLTAILARLHKRRPDLELASVIPESMKTWRERIETLPYFENTFPPHWRSPST